MTKPDEQTLAAFSRLTRDPDGQRLIEWLKSNRENLWRLNDLLMGESPIVGRGKTLALTEIIGAIEGAASTLERKTAERNRVIPE